MEGDSEGELVGLCVEGASEGELVGLAVEGASEGGPVGLCVIKYSRLAELDVGL